eukprot:TRINITY_DN14714_c0_g1_i2.p1 TRINITY_DN14714_c0_g1~~TRINITY_DN14714_c0_g1_i2.p1  ORF type:complete len:463 (+),score=99.89 TRINITY_DN14714_c0_g1_i2:77-1465(+)
MTKTTFLFFCCCFVLLSSSIVLARNIPIVNDDEDVVVAAPPKPILPSDWFDPNVTMVGGPITFRGPVWMDATNHNYKQVVSVHFFNETLSSVIYLTSTQTVYDINGVCRNLSSQGLSGSFWSWLPFASYNGQVYVNGRGPCDEWVLRIPSKGVLVLDVINGTLPVRFIAPGAGSITSPDATGNTTFLFSPQFAPATYTAANSSIFDLPPECFTMEVCPAGPIMNETFFLFHGANDYTLINTNVADELGDISFVCAALISKSFTYFNWVSQYTLTVNTTFGQYGLCNFGSCLGGAQDRVGQEAAEGAAATHGGQCQPNSDLGNWYSLPQYNATLCPGGGLGDDTYNETVGINGTAWSGCGWKVAEKVKTIDGQCLEAHGFVNACLSDLGYPWKQAVAVWDQAFSSDDVSNGGCPPIVNGTLYDEEVFENYNPPTARLSEHNIHAALQNSIEHLFALLNRIQPH